MFKTILAAGLMAFGVLTTSVVSTPYAQEPGGNVLIITGKFDDSVLEKAAETLVNIPDGAKLTIVIDSPGGYVYVEDFLQNFIKLKHLSTTCIVPSFAASAAATTAVTCNTLITSDNATFLFHMKFTVDAAGNKVRTKEMIADEVKQWGPLMQKLMTKVQYQGWLAGEDIIISGKQIKERLV